jgi:hypothetical protein
MAELLLRLKTGEVNMVGGSVNLARLAEGDLARGLGALLNGAEEGWLRAEVERLVRYCTAHLPHEMLAGHPHLVALAQYPEISAELPLKARMAGRMQLPPEITRAYGIVFSAYPEEILALVSVGIPFRCEVLPNEMAGPIPTLGGTELGAGTTLVILIILVHLITCLASEGKQRQLIPQISSRVNLTFKLVKDLVGIVDDLSRKVDKLAASVDKISARMDRARPPGSS